MERKRMWWLGVAIAWIASTGHAQEEQATEVMLVQVQLAADGGTILGFPLPLLVKDRVVLISQSGELHDLPMSEVGSFEVQSKHPVTQVPAHGLVAALGLDDAAARDQSYDWIREQGSAAATALADGLTRLSPEARWRALKLLAPHARTAHRTAVRASLQDNEPKVRKYALRICARLDPESMVRTCERVLRFDADPRVRHEAIVLLGHCGDVHAVDPLLDHLLQTEERSLKLQSFVALKRLTGQWFGKDPAKWRAWWTNHRDEVIRQQEQARWQAD